MSSKKPDNERQVDALVRACPFPMMNGPNIGWDVAEMIYRRYCRLYGTDQTLERIAERGGFSWTEVENIWNEDRRQTCTP